MAKAEAVKVDVTSKLVPVLKNLTHVLKAIDERIATLEQLANDAESRRKKELAERESIERRIRDGHRVDC